jgi:uncharacterized protein (TIGR04255 family)
MSREIYANAPLRLVAAELRYPYAPKLGSAEVLEELTAGFRNQFPIPEQAGVQVLMAMASRAGAATQPSAANRFLAKDRTSSVTVTPTNFLLETTQYQGYRWFRSLLESSLAALGARAQAIVGLERVGLRYVNEIRVPGLTSLTEWEHYVSKSLVASMSILGDREPSSTQGVVQSESIDKVSILVRFGALRGQVVSAAGSLKVKPVAADDPFFMVDIDSSWSSDNSFDEYSVGAALKICDTLHDPIDDLFDQTITERLRKEVLRSAS